MIFLLPRLSWTPCLRLRQMDTANTQSSSDIDVRKILLIGDINKAFFNADTISKLPCQVRNNILDAIDSAAKNSFLGIGVVMSGTSVKLSSALKALRKVNSDAKIILLAQMHEEPAAMQLAYLVSNGEKTADDYLICPVNFSHLVSRISYLVQEEAARGLHEAKLSIGAPVIIDYSTEKKIKHLEKLATEDELTGLKNRRYIWEFSRQIIAHARRENGRVTVLIFDIDDFKHYNDVYGHSAGDEILKQAAALMRRCCRGHDVVGRIGGDEFAVVFWGDPQIKRPKKETDRRSSTAEHPKEPIFIAQRFRRELNKAEFNLLGPEGKGVLTISGGLASFPRDGATVQELFQQADKALLEAKRSGKNRIYLVGKPPNDIADIE